MSETNVSLNAELRDELADEIEAKIAESKKADVLLDVDDLCVTLFTEDGELPAIRHLNLVMRKGETLAVVGESGCGKSMTALSIMGLLPQPPARIVGGSINLEGTDLAKLSRDEMRSFRGSKMGMIFQEPMTSLNPVMKAGLQIREGILVHNPKMDKKEADARALEMIKLVGIPAPEKVFKSYPHELSGGMRQRVMIAMALACQPSLLICDEPTTALDVTIQAQILQLIDHMRESLVPPSCSSPTTWASCPRWPTGSPSCTPATWWSTPPRASSSPTPSIPTPSASSTPSPRWTTPWRSSTPFPAACPC